MPLFSHIGNHTFAAVKGTESYNLLAAAFAEVFDEVNRLIADPVASAGGREWNLTFKLGSDYKVHVYFVKLL